MVCSPIIYHNSYKALVIINSLICIILVIHGAHLLITLQLLQQTGQTLRNQHFKHYEKAREDIEKRVKVLQLLKKNQMNELQKLNQEKQILQEKAEQLAEKYEDIKDKQEDLRIRWYLLVVTSRFWRLITMNSYCARKPLNSVKSLDLKNQVWIWSQKKITTF